MSVSSDGVQGNNESGDANISGDGRYVAFASTASNLVPNDTNGAFDVFVHDRVTGTTERVSVDSSGRQSNALSFRPSIDRTGRIIVFESDASNLVAVDTNNTGCTETFAECRDVFAHDRVTGTTEMISVNSLGVQGDCTSWYPSVSADGRFVAFVSCSVDLALGDLNLDSDVFVRDRVAGTTELVSIDPFGHQWEAGVSADRPSITADGRFVSFSAGSYSPAIPELNGVVFVRDRTTQTTKLVSRPGCCTDEGMLSEDGRFVIFRDYGNGAIKSAIIVDLSSGNDSYEEASGNYLDGVTISGDGMSMAFDVDDGVVPGDTNGAPDVYVHTHTGVDLSVQTHLVGVLQLLPGADATLDLSIANRSLSPGTGVVLTDELPKGMLFVSVTPTQGMCARHDRTVTCAIGTLPPRSEADVHITLRPTHYGEFTNTASVTGNEPDPILSNNSDPFSGEVRPPCLNCG